MYSIEPIFRRPRTLGFSLTAAALVSAQAAMGATPVSTAIGMNVPTVVAGATLVSHVTPSKVLSMTIGIAPANRAGLEAFARSVSDPHSHDFHRFLSPAQVGARFGASTSTVNTLVSYLKSKGMTVTMVADSHLAILFKGTVAQAESAFATRINNYKVASRTTKGPLAFYSFASKPLLPTALAPQIVTIQGLDNANPPIGKTSQLKPIDARTVYNAAPLYGASSAGGHKGEGINIGVSNFDGYRLSNAAVFASAFNLPLPGGTGTNIHKVIVGGVDGESVAEGGEGDLDFQMVLGIAPKANVYIYDGIGGGLIATLAQEAQDNLVDIVTESYGFAAGDDFYLAAHDQHLAMTAQGITYMGASGDSGTADPLSFPYPGFDPDVLEVGGSDVTLNASGGRGSEFGWEGSGSGWYQGSIYYNVLPPYQAGFGVPTNNNHRLIPDIAVHATAWYFSFGGVIGGVGGTSAATPSFAGQLGLILQTLAENDAVDLASNGRPRLGRIQDVIYPLNASGSSDAFYDITGVSGKGNAGVLPDGTLSVATPGWDFVTGLGAPDDLGLYNAYLNLSLASVGDLATSASVYSIASPRLVLGAGVQGDASNLSATDGTSYSVQSVAQSGVGQVAAAAIGFNLQGDPTLRRRMTVSASLSTANLTVGYVYLLNTQTNAYELMSSVVGSGAMKSVSIPITSSADLAKYAPGGTLTMLVRATKPARLGAAPFRLSVDQATVTERLARS